jgi:hypothetical protein
VAGGESDDVSKASYSFLIQPQVVLSPSLETMAAVVAAGMWVTGWSRVASPKLYLGP